MIDAVRSHLANPPSFCLCHLFVPVEYLRVLLLKALTIGVK